MANNKFLILILPFFSTVFKIESNRLELVKSIKIPSIKNLFKLKDNYLREEIDNNVSKIESPFQYHYCFEPEQISNNIVQYNKNYMYRRTEHVIDIFQNQLEEIYGKDFTAILLAEDNICSGKKRNRSLKGGGKIGMFIHALLAAFVNKDIFHVITLTDLGCYDENNIDKSDIYKNTISLIDKILCTKYLFLSDYSLKTDLSTIENTILYELLNSSKDNLEIEYRDYLIKVNNEEIELIKNSIEEETKENLKNMFYENKFNLVIDLALNKESISIYSDYFKENDAYFIDIEIIANSLYKFIQLTNCYIDYLNKNNPRIGKAVSHFFYNDTNYQTTYQYLDKESRKDLEKRRKSILDEFQDLKYIYKEYKKDENHILLMDALKELIEKENQNN